MQWYEDADEEKVRLKDNEAKLQEENEDSFKLQRMNVLKEEIIILQNEN